MAVSNEGGMVALPDEALALLAAHRQPDERPITENTKAIEAEVLRRWIAKGFAQFAKSEPDFAISWGLANRAAEAVLSQPWPAALQGQETGDRDGVIEEMLLSRAKYLRTPRGALNSHGTQKMRRWLPMNLNGNPKQSAPLPEMKHDGT